MVTRKRVNLSLNVHEHRHLEDYAKQEGKTVSTLVHDIIKYMLMNRQNHIEETRRAARVAEGASNVQKGRTGPDNKSGGDS